MDPSEPQLPQQEDCHSPDATHATEEEPPKRYPMSRQRDIDTEFIARPSVRVRPGMSGSADGTSLNTVTLEVDYPVSTWLELASILIPIGGFEVTSLPETTLRFLSSSPDDITWDDDEHSDLQFLNDLAIVCDASSAFYEGWVLRDVPLPELRLGLTMALMERRLLTAPRSHWDAMLKSSDYGRHRDDLNELFREVRRALARAV